MIQSFDVSHKLTEQQWCKKLFMEFIPNTFFFPFMGTGIESPIIIKDELDKEVGSTLTIPKLFLLDPSSGVVGSATLEGNEQDMTYGDDAMTAEQIRNGVRIQGGMSTQLTSRKVREDAKNILSIWKEQELDNKIFSVLTANPTANRLLAADATAGNDVEIPPVIATAADLIATTDILTVKGIRAMKLHARRGNAGAAEKIRPYRTIDRKGKDIYLFFVDDFSLQDLKNDPDYEAYAREEGKGRAAFFEGGVVDIDGVMIIECDKIERSLNAGGVMVSRNIFMGAAAVALTWAGKTKNGTKRGSHVQWSEAEYDYGEQYGIALGDIKGVKKIRFNKDGVAQDDNAVIQFLAASIAP